MICLSLIPTKEHSKTANTKNMVSQQYMHDTYTYLYTYISDVCIQSYSVHVCIQSYSVHVCIQCVHIVIQCARVHTVHCYATLLHISCQIFVRTAPKCCNMQSPGVGIGLESLLSTLASDKRLKWWWCQMRNNFRGRGEEGETHLTQILPLILPHTNHPTHMHTHTHTHTHTHAHACTHTHTCTHTHLTLVLAM